MVKVVGLGFHGARSSYASFCSAVRPVMADQLTGQEGSGWVKRGVGAGKLCGHGAKGVGTSWEKPGLVSSYGITE